MPSVSDHGRDDEAQRLRDAWVARKLAEAPDLTSEEWDSVAELLREVEEGSG